MSKELSGKCKKCRSPGEYLWCSGGEFYLFCRGCDAVLKNHYTGDVVRAFLDGDLNLSEEEKGILKARIDRNKEKKMWKDKE